MTYSNGSNYWCLNLDAVFFLLTISLNTQPTRPLGIRKDVAPKCRSECKGQYDLCDSRSENLKKQITCFSEKLTCLFKCANQKHKRNQPKDHPLMSAAPLTLSSEQASPANKHLLLITVTARNGALTGNLTIIKP